MPALVYENEPAIQLSPMGEELRPHICLCMTVKDEAAIIERALTSALPWIDTWCINDTGSTDGTQAIIMATMRNMPGRLLDAPWIDFGHNRTLSFVDARMSRADYIFVMDADQTLHVDDADAWAHLTMDAYNLTIKHGSISYPRPVLLRPDLPWHWKQVTHEYLACDAPYQQRHLEGVYVREHADSSRRRGNRKNLEDIALLERALAEEPENERAVFYLAQSYRDEKRFADATRLYQLRIAMGGWKEEIWCAAHGIARILQWQGEWDQAVIAFTRAYEIDPSRAESAYYLASGYLNRQSFPLAKLWFEEAACMEKLVDRLFIEDAVYDYAAQLGYAIACHGLGEHDLAERAEAAILAQNSTPADIRAGIMKMRMTHQIMPLAYVGR